MLPFLTPTVHDTSLAEIQVRELLDKQVNAQKECSEQTLGGLGKPTKSVQ